MKKDIEHVVTSTAMFVIAFIASTVPEPVKVDTPRRRRLRGPGLAWMIGAAALVGALAWSMDSYVTHVAVCEHLRLQGPPLPPMQLGAPPPPSQEYLDLSAMGIETILLTAFVFFAIRAVRRRRASR